MQKMSIQIQVKIHRKLDLEDLVEPNAQWECLTRELTKKFEEYGTIELVNSVLEILDDSNFIEMRNHGFLSLCNSMTEAGLLALEVYNRCK